MIRSREDKRVDSFLNDLKAEMEIVEQSRDCDPKRKINSYLKVLTGKL